MAYETEQQFNFWLDHVHPRSGIPLDEDLLRMKSLFEHGKPRAHGEMDRARKILSVIGQEMQQHGER